MISEKMKAFTANSSAIRAMFEEGKKMAAVYGAENVYDFSLGNPSAPPPEIVNQTAIQILSNESPFSVHGYTNNCGDEQVREKIAQQTNKEFDTNYTQNNIVLTCGAAGGLSVIFRTLLNPQDEVIVFAPFFGEYNSYVKNFDGNLVVVKSNPSDFQIPFELLESKITKKTKAVIINSPNNPTGVIYSEQTIKNLADLLETKQKEIGHPIYLISDEPYRYLAYDNAKVPFTASYYKNTFVAYSFSKSLSLPGERIGYLIANTEMDGFEEIIDAFSTANRILGFVNAPSLFQKVIRECVDVKVNTAVYEKNRTTLYNMLTELGFECVKPSGAFYLFPKSLEDDDKAFCNTAKEFRILCVPASSFGYEGHFRLSYCVDYKTIENSYDSFKALAKKYGR